jgi:hypothetical protein
VDRPGKCSYRLTSRTVGSIKIKRQAAGKLSMQWRRVRQLRRAFCLLHPLRLLTLAVLAASAGGCSVQVASFGGPVRSGSTMTFESIDGPPPEVFQKLVSTLNEEAGAQKIAVVSRSTPATYRVRGYMSAMVERNRTSFTWVWDVYDADRNRVLRISGEEPASSTTRRRGDAWAAADEQVLRGMSRNGMQRFAAFLNSDAPPPTATESPLVTLASARRDDSPEAAGIFRSFGTPEQTVSAGEPEPDVPASQPAPRPRAKKQPAATVGSGAPARQSTALVAGQ